MKRSLMLVISIALLCLFFTSCSAADEATGPSYFVTFAADRTDFPDLMNIQDKVYGAFVQSIMTKAHSPLEEIENKLDKAYETNQQNIVLYWQSYAQYYSSIYYIQSGEKEAAEKHIKAAIERLEKMKGKNSEDYALLSMAQSFSIQFQSAFGAMTTSGKVKKNGEKAMELDPQNLRAYYVLGSSDYYTPEKYGGGQKVEEFLLTALEKPDQSMENPYLPSWGRAEAWEMLIKFYIKKEKWDQAKAQFQAANAYDPDNYQISKLGSALVGK